MQFYKWKIRVLFRVCSRIVARAVAAEVTRRILARKTLPSRYLGGYNVTVALAFVIISISKRRRQRYNL